MKKKPHFYDCTCKYTEEGDLPKDHKWYVKSPMYHNCFWTYLRYNDRPHTLNDIAQLMGLSISAITSIEKKAIAKLRKKTNQIPSKKY